MANPHKFYLDYMHSKTGYRATWDPGKPLKVGQIGKLDGSGIFSAYSSLEKEGFTVEILSDTSAGEMDYTSHNSVTITTKLSGTAPVTGSALTDLEAGFSFDFQNDKSIVFQTSGHKTHVISNLGEITDKVLQKYKDKNWDKDWVIITELTEADTATIIISNSSKSGLELKAKAGAGIQGLKLTDTSLGLTVARESGSTLKYISQSGLTPLYRVMGIKDPLIGKIKVAVKGADELPEEDQLEVIPYDPGTA